MTDEFKRGVKDFFDGCELNYNPFDDRYISKDKMENYVQWQQGWLAAEQWKFIQDASNNE